jgi:hypothetical protein
VERVVWEIIIHRKAPKAECRDVSQGGQVEPRPMRVKRCLVMLHDGVLDSSAQPVWRTTRQLNVRQEWNTMTLLRSGGGRWLVISVCGNIPIWPQLVGAFECLLHVQEVCLLHPDIADVP